LDGRWAAERTTRRGVAVDLDDRIERSERIYRRQFGLAWLLLGA
jgi:hypothetical protein